MKVKTIARLLQASTRTEEDASDDRLELVALVNAKVTQLQPLALPLSRVSLLFVSLSLSLFLSVSVFVFVCVHIYIYTHTQTHTHTHNTYGGTLLALFVHYIIDT
jgi:hypothetical protein